MITNLCGGLARLGAQVDLLLIRREAPYTLSSSESIRVLPLRANHNLSAVPEIAAYLRRERPRAVLAAKDRAIAAVALARRLAGVECRVVGRLGTTVSAGIAHKNPLARWMRKRMMRLAHASINGTVCVSRGVAQDLASITGLPLDKFPVIPNPVITADLKVMAEDGPNHPWFLKEGAPVIMGMGRLTRQKGFDTLIRAFAMVRRQMDARLLILGEGRDRPQLEALAEALGLAGSVDLPGFSPNPYAMLSRASLFCLSSRWEGSPNALTEALALGTPAVSTDCPSGPREILRDGEVCPLVPVDRPEAMAEAMIRTLKNPPPAELLRAAAAPYSLEASARRYLDILLQGPGG